MDNNTLNMLMMVMLMGRGSSNMMLPLMLMMMSSPNQSSGNSFSSMFTPQAMMTAMMPGLGSVGKYITGGSAALALSSLMKKPKPYRRYPARRTVYINSGGYRGGYYGRRR